jgi:hypothetical protein
MCKYGEELIVGDVVFGLLSPNNSDVNNIGICVKIGLSVGVELCYEYMCNYLCYNDGIIM